MCQHRRLGQRFALGTEPLAVNVAFDGKDTRRVVELLSNLLTDSLQAATAGTGSKASKRGLSEEQTAVLICRDRTGNTADFMLEKADKAHIGAVLKPLLAADVILCTDGEKALAAVAKKMGITPTVRSIQPLVSVSLLVSIMSRTSMPTIADPRNGCAASMAGYPLLS